METVPKVYNVMGRTVLLQRNNYGIVHVEAALSTGFIHEEETTSGISHLLEHILTDGWGGCGKMGSCSRYWEEKGVNMNASTDQSFMNFFVEGLPNEVKPMISYICTISETPTFSDAVLANEKKAVTNELLTYGAEPDSPLQTAFNHAMYTGGIALKDDWELQIRNLKRLNLHRLREAFERCFNPANVVYLVISNLRHDEVLPLFEAQFRKTPAAPALPLQTVDCFRRQPNLLFVRADTGKNMTLKLGFPSVRTPLDNVLIPLLCSVLHNLLFDALRTTSHLVYNIRVENDDNVCGGVLFLQYDVLEKNLLQSWNIVQAVLEKYHKTMLPDKNVYAARQRFIFDHHKEQRYTEDFVQQFLFRPKDAVVFYSRDDKLKVVSQCSARALTALYRRVCPLEEAVCAYQGSKELIQK
jgi:predicted Zn-dependent peptidase